MTPETQLAGVQGQKWAIPMADALRWSPRGSAYAAFEEALEGTIEAVRLADLIALSVDPFTAAPTEARDARVRLTMVGGRLVHDGTADRSQGPGPRGAGGFAAGDGCHCAEPTG